MVTRTSSTRRTPAFSATQSSVQPSPTIKSIVVTDSNYVDLDDTAINTTGGYIKLKGFGFTANSLVLFNGANVTNTYVSSTEYRAVIPATSAGTYNVMIFNNNIGAIYTGSSVSGFPSWTQTSYANYSLTVSVQLLATGDGTLTYSLYSGTLPSDLTLSANGLISGTVTADSVTSDLVFLVNDSQNQTTQQTVTLTISSIDTYWKNTSLLLTGENNAIAANTAYNLDSSNNNFTLTSVGSPTPTRISPFASPTSSDGSTYFNGSTDYLQIAHDTKLDLGSGNFTVEFWLNAPNWSSGTAGLIGKKLSDATNGWQLYRDAGTPTKINARLGLANNFFTTSTVTPYVWEHWALVRTGTTVYWFKNGVLDANTTSSLDASDSSAPFNIGYGTTWTAYGHFNLSNLRIVKGQALYTANFTPSTTTLTTTSQSANSANVSLLTCLSNATFDNNRIVDYSSNTTSNLNFTRTGNTSISTFSPYGTNWSYYDDGASILGVPANSQYIPGTANFTVECWINLCSYTNASIITSHQTGGMFSWSANASGYLASALNTSGGSTTAYTNLNLASNPLSLGVWYHVAYVRNGTEVSMFINGVKNATTLTLSPGTNVGSYGGAKTWYIGGSSDRGSKGNLYISNFRFVVNTAIYTSNFTPSTTPLTSIEGSNTKILICQDNRFKDNSPIAASLTADTSVPRVARPGPFAETAAWAFDNNQVGSYYFNGSTDYYRITTATTALGLSTTDFTVEFWVYWNSVAVGNNGSIIDMRASGGGASQVKFAAFLVGAGSFSYVTSNTSRITQTVIAGQWYHIAIVRSSGSTKMYVNGTANATTYTDANDYGTSAQLSVGTYGDAPGSVNGWFSGYIADVRVVKGTAVYTANFTPPTAPLTAIANTTMLLNGKSTGVLDYTGQHAIITSGNSRVSPTQEKFGNRSLYFDGSGDYLQVVSMFNPLGISTGDFTIEGWLYTATVASGRKTICATRTSASDTTTGRFSVYANTANLEFFSASANVAFGGTITTNTWTHFAVTRSSGNVRLFLSGTQVGSTTSYTAALPSNLTLTVGDNAAGTESWNGYLDELRITKGYARYVANFIVPNNAYQQL
jgi:hypothetical protein